jgi:hypothetical protein
MEITFNPAYAEGFGEASTHLSRRLLANAFGVGPTATEGGTRNVQCRQRVRDRGRKDCG